MDEKIIEDLKDIINLLDWRPKDNPNAVLELGRTSQDEWKQKLELVLKIIERKDCVIETQGHNEEVLMEYFNRHSCLRCDEGKPAYCEKCFQEAIAWNAKLQEKLNEERLNKYEIKCLGTDEDRQTCNVEKMGCEGCAYEPETNRVHIEVQKFINLLMTGDITIDYSPITMQYVFRDKNGNTIEVKPDVYLKIVNYIEKGEIYD